MSKGVWLISVAVLEEAHLLIKYMRRSFSFRGIPVWYGKIGLQDFFLVVTGIGMVNAATVLGIFLGQYPKVKAILNIGCSGAYEDSGLKVGDVVLATKIILVDQGVKVESSSYPLREAGVSFFKRGYNTFYNSFFPDDGLNSRFFITGIARGSFASVFQISGSLGVASEISSRWGVVLEDMESGAVAQASTFLSLPFASLRGVSNITGIRNINVKVGSEAAQIAFLESFKSVF